MRPTSLQKGTIMSYKTLFVVAAVVLTLGGAAYWFKKN